MVLSFLPELSEPSGSCTSSCKRSEEKEGGLKEQWDGPLGAVVTGPGRTGDGCALYVFSPSSSSLRGQP